MSDISRESEVSQALQVLRGRLAHRVKKDTMGPEVKEDPRAPQEPLARPDHRDLRDPREMEYTSDGVGFKDRMRRVQDPWRVVWSSSLLLCQETQECAAPEDSVANRASLVKLVKKDLKGTLDLPGRPVIKVTEVNRGGLENRVPKDQTGPEVPPDP